MDTYAGKTAIVTGAASGIGLEVSRELARRGAAVIMADLNVGLLEKEVNSLKQYGLQVEMAPLDVTDFDAVKMMVQEALANHGRIDYMFNNAAIAIGGRAHEHSREAWSRVIDTNLNGVINGVVTVYPAMIGQGCGHIVNTASTGGLVPVSGVISYITSKHAVVGLSLALRMEASQYGVKVSVVCPGFIKTPIYDTTELINMDREKLKRILPRGSSPQKAARVILADVERNRAVIICPRQARVIWWLNRLAPGLVSRVVAFYGRESFRRTSI